MFSGRLPALAPNRLGLALEERRRSGAGILDLTETNPTRVGLGYPTTLLDPLANPLGLAYEPDPLGMRSARDAIAIDLLRLGIDVDPARLVLTASTSEAYAFLFKVLCDPGDQVLVPTPSYPLFDHLTRLEAVTAVPYPLDPHGTWSIDPAAIARLVSSRTRAVLVVSPNNPTGTMLRRRVLDELAALCRDAGLMLIGDEVFADYRFAQGSAETTPFVSVLQQRECLACSLGGLSKSIGAPQLKLAWIAVDGPGPLVRAALDRLALVGDTFLSVSTPVQLAAPALLEHGKPVRACILNRVVSNLQALRRALDRATACSLVEPDGGWSACLRVPADEPEETRVLRLLDRHGVLVSPGYFYDFPFEAFLVISLLGHPDVFAAGLDRLVNAIQPAGGPG
jgi:alanine-synthesizing transaminase